LWLDDDENCAGFLLIEPHCFGEKKCVAYKRSTNQHTSGYVQVFGRRDDGLTTDCGGRRPKSAKARSHGKLGTGGATGAMGI
jgi:hypothetical protein